MNWWANEVCVKRAALFAFALAGGAVSMVSTTASAGFGNPVKGQIQVCVVDPSSRSFTFALTEGATSGGGPIAGDSAAVDPGLVPAGSCAVVATSNVTGAAAAFIVGINLAGASLASDACINLNVSVSCSGSRVMLDVNGSHGSVVTFTLARVPPPSGPPPQNLPVFVIGDVQPHALGNNVNFWGAQWWTNNIMSGPTIQGNSKAGFNGYANGGDILCGGNWESLPGNSAPPPATIPARAMVVVTSTVIKNGPNLGGDIVQILLVNQDGNYQPNPGHEGNGPVASIVCTK